MPPVLWNGDQGPKRRIGLAIAISLLVHYLLAGSWSGSGQGSHTANMPWVQMRSGIPYGISAALVPAADDGAKAVEPTGQQELRRLSASPATATVADASARETSDDRYYSARELDRYPIPAVPLDFSRSVPPGIAGHARLFVDIDLGGRVVGLSVIEADPPGLIEEGLRDMMLRTLFTPASRNGRAVNSRIMMELRTP